MAKSYQKKPNPLAITIKELYGRNYKQCEIAKMLNVSKQVVSKWVNKEITKVDLRSKKLPKYIIDKIVSWAKDKPTFKMSSRIIAAKLNSYFEKTKKINPRTGKIFYVSHTTINNYLKEYYGAPIKIRKVFFLSEEQKKARVELCKKLIEKNITFDRVFWTDECRLVLNPVCSGQNNAIRITKEEQKDLKENCNPEVIEKISIPRKKFEESIMVAGGVSYYGLGKLIICCGTMNWCSYAQSLLFFNEDIKETNHNLVFEQDGAKCHTCSFATDLLNNLFGSEGWYQNSPNSPDLASPIELIWNILKAGVRKYPCRTIEELKASAIKVWYSIPLSLVQNIVRHFDYRVRKIIEINGNRLDREVLRKIKLENKNNQHIWKEIDEENLPPLRVVFNNEIIDKIKKITIKVIKKEIKSIPKLYKIKIKDAKEAAKKKNLRNRSLGVALHIINEPERLLKEKDEILDKKKVLITEITKMDSMEFLKNFDDELKQKIASGRIPQKIKKYVELKIINKKENNRNNDYDSESTTCDIDDKIDEITQNALFKQELLKRRKRIKQSFIDNINLVFENENDVIIKESKECSIDKDQKEENETLSDEENESEEDEEKEAY